MGVSVGACLVFFLCFGNNISKYILNLLEPCCFEILIILHLRFCFLKFSIHSCSTDDSTTSLFFLQLVFSKKVLATLADRLNFFEKFNLSTTVAGTFFVPKKKRLAARKKD